MLAVGEITRVHIGDVSDAYLVRADIQRGMSVVAWRAGLTALRQSAGRKPEHTTRIHPIRPSRSARYACCSTRNRPSGLLTLNR